MDKWTKGIVGLVLLAACLHTAGCGGVPGELRVATGEVARAVDEADVLATAQYEARRVELREELQRMAREGRLASVEAGLSWYDAQEEPYAVADRVLTAAAGSLRAVELALDAWDAGESDAPNRVGDALACSVAAVAEVAAVLPALGLDVPEALRTWGTLIAQYASSGCPEGGE